MISRGPAIGGRFTVMGGGLVAGVLVALAVWDLGPGLPQGLMAVIAALLALLVAEAVAAALRAAPTIAKHPSVWPRELPPDGPRVAIVVPFEDGDPAAVAGRVVAMHRDLERCPGGHRCEFFLLSDSEDPAAWIREERCWLALRERLVGRAVFYRHRCEERGRPHGNLAELVERWGGRYRLLLVLGTDSLLTGSAIMRLVAWMECTVGCDLRRWATRPLARSGPVARALRFAAATAAGSDAGAVAILRPERFLGRGDRLRLALAGRAGVGLGELASSPFERSPAADPGIFAVAPATLDQRLERERGQCRARLRQQGLLGLPEVAWRTRLAVLGQGLAGLAPLGWSLLLVLAIVAVAHPSPVAEDAVAVAVLVSAILALRLLPALLVLVRTPRAARRRATLDAVLALALTPALAALRSRAALECLSGVERLRWWFAGRRTRSRARRPLLPQAWLWLPAAGLAVACALWAPLLLVCLAPVILALVLTPPVAGLLARRERTGSGAMTTIAGREPAVAVAARAAEGELRIQLADLEGEDFWQRFFASPAAVALHCAMVEAAGGSSRSMPGRRPSLRTVLRDPRLCREVHDRILGQGLAGESRPSWRQALTPILAR